MCEWFKPKHWLLLVVIVVLELKELKMSVDNLNASITKLDTDIDTLISQGANSVPQADVDASQARLDVIDAKVVAATTPAQQ